MITNNIDGGGNKLEIGDVVLQRFRENGRKGIVIGFDHGCNGGTIVQWENQPFNSYMVTKDLIKQQVQK
jgi:hypothetical protein